MPFCDQYGKSIYLKNYNDEILKSFLPTIMVKKYEKFKSKIKEGKL